MEALKTQIEFYRFKGHKIPNLESLSEDDMNQVLIQLQEADYKQFKSTMAITEAMLLNGALGIFGPGETKVSDIRDSVIVDMIANPDNYDIMDYRGGKSQHDICLGKIHRIKCLYILSLMTNYITLGDAFDSEDYDRYVRIMRCVDIYVQQYEALTPDILKRISETGDYSHIFLDPDVVAIMDRVKELDLRPILLQNDDDLKIHLKESLADLKSSMAELRQVCSENRAPITIGPETAEVLNESLQALATSLNQLGQKEEKCCVM